MRHDGGTLLGSSGRCRKTPARKRQPAAVLAAVTKAFLGGTLIRPSRLSLVGGLTLVRNGAIARRWALRTASLVCASSPGTTPERNAEGTRKVSAQALDGPSRQGTADRVRMHPTERATYRSEPKICAAPVKASVVLTVGPVDTKAVSLPGLGLIWRSLGDIIAVLNGRLSRAAAIGEALTRPVTTIGMVAVTVSGASGHLSPWGVLLVTRLSSTSVSNRGTDATEVATTSGTGSFGGGTRGAILPSVGRAADRLASTARAAVRHLRSILGPVQLVTVASNDLAVLPPQMGTEAAGERS